MAEEAPPPTSIATSIDECREQDVRDSIYSVGIQEALPRFVVELGSESIWDQVLKIQMKPAALRLWIGRNTYKEWESSPLKLVVHPSQVVFDPTMTCSPDCVNLYGGLALHPIKGDCADLLALLMHLLSESADTDAGIVEVLNFVLNWLAFPLQHPGAKMATALVIHGPQGSGKSLFFEAYSRIFGEYAKTIGQAQLESRYNDWLSRALLLVCEEIVASNELTHYKNALKSFVTATKLQIETKFQQVRTENNHANFVFLSNDSRPLSLEKDDRRHLVIYCPPKLEKDFYTKVYESLDQGAVEAFYEFLLSRDLGDFHAHSLPPMTNAKRELVELGLRPAERFAKEWIGKELDLPLHPCSTAQLYRAFTRWCRMNGDRLPPNQANFSAAVTRYAHNRLSRHVVSPSPSEHGSAIRLWMPAGTGPIEGVRWFDFAHECIAAFEGPLSRFCAQSVGDSQ
jgi:putative DNA primase/helicase